MAGTVRSVRINGIEFSYPGDCTPSIVEGGRHITDNQTFSDGTSEPIESYPTPGIFGNKISVREGKYEQFKSLIGKKNLPIIYDGANKSAEFTGYIQTPDGFKVDSSTNLTEDFNLICSTGKMNVTNIND